MATSTSSARYSLKPDPYSSHRQIADWLRAYQKRRTSSQPCVVYDIGCAQGFLGQLLPASDFMLFGVDADEVALEAARTFYHDVQLADLEGPLTFAFPTPPEVMVLADVLEHTRAPEECLSRLCRRYLSPGARLVISLPNVAHLHVRWSLLWGRFQYTERGLLDRTHLRFFTRASAVSMVRAGGVEIEQMAVTPTPLPLVNPLFGEGRRLWPLHQFNAFCARAWPTLLGYQTILYGIYRP